MVGRRGSPRRRLVGRCTFKRQMPLMSVLCLRERNCIPQTSNDQSRSNDIDGNRESEGDHPPLIHSRNQVGRAGDHALDGIDKHDDAGG